MKRPNNSSTPSSPGTSISKNNSDRNSHHLNTNIRQYSLLSSDKDGAQDDDDNDDDTMSLSFYHQQPCNMNDDTTSSDAVTGTTIVYAVSKAVPKMTTSFSTKNYIDDMTLDDVLEKFEVWVREDLVSRHSKEVLSRLQETNHQKYYEHQHSQAQTYLQQVLELSKNCIETSVNHANRPIGTSASTTIGPKETISSPLWNVSRVIRFMKFILLPCLRHYVHMLPSVLQRSKGTEPPPEHHTQNTDGAPNDITISETSFAESMICMIYMTLHQLMEHHHIWNTYLIYVATTTSVTTHSASAIIDGYLIDSDDQNELTLFSIFQTTFQYVINITPEPNATIIENPTQHHLLLTQSLFILYTNVWDAYQSNHDHCTLSNVCSTPFGSDNMANDRQHPDSKKAMSWWNHEFWDDNDSLKLLRMTCNGIVSDYSTFQSEDDSHTSYRGITKKYVLSCCSFLKILMRKQQRRRTSDCVTSRMLQDENDIVVKMMNYVRNHIENHHLSYHRRTQSSNSSTTLSSTKQKYADIDIHISLRYIEVLVTMYAERISSNSMCDNKQNILDEIRRLILVDHSFAQYLIETMLLSTISTTTTDHNGSGIALSTFDNSHVDQLLQQELSLSIVTILYDLIPDTIDTILSSQLLNASFTTKMPATNINPKISEQRQQNQHSLIHSYIYRALDALITNALTHQRAVNHTVECLLFLHTAQRATARQCMLSYMVNGNEATSSSLDGPTKTCKLLHRLLHYTEIYHSLPSVSFIEQLLSGPTDILRHDDLSRQIRYYVCDMPTSTPVDKAQPLIFKHCSIWQSLTIVLMSNKDDHKVGLCRVPKPPVLIKLIDIAYIVVQNVCSSLSSENQQSHDKPNVKSAITTTTIEHLLEIITPVNELASGASNECFVSSEENTPTVQNLSRCDMTMNINETICYSRTEAPTYLHDVDTSILNQHGLFPWEQCIQLSVATFLTELTNKYNYRTTGLSVCHDEIVIRERILDAVNEYVVQTNVMSTLFHTMSDTDITDCRNVLRISLPYTSPDINRRRLRLLTVLAQLVDNEECLANNLHISEQKHQGVVLDVLKRLDHCMLQVKAYQEQEEQLLLENKSLSEQLISLDIKSRYEQNEMHRKITQRAKQLVAVHAMERQNMEKEVQHMSESAVKNQNELRAHQQSEQQLQIVIEETTNKLNLLISVEKENAVRINHLENEAGQMSKDLSNTKVLLQNASKESQTLEKEWSNQAQQIEELKQSEAEVRNCLENLFGDMVKLAHAYVAKENEVDKVDKKYKEKLKELQLRLQAEQEQNKQYDQQERQKQYDYDLLQRKYQRLKEKLELERQEHQRKLEEETQRNKRNGPISYMNQLHHNASLMNSSGTTTSERSSVARKGTTNNAIDKENLNSVTSSNHRRDRLFR